MLINLAAYAGMKIGEIFDLDITQIDTAKKTIRIENQCLEVGGKKMRIAPKFGKVRTTISPTKHQRVTHLLHSYSAALKD